MIALFALLSTAGAVTLTFKILFSFVMLFSFAFGITFMLSCIFNF